MLLREEEPCTAFFEYLRPDQPADRAVPLGHVQPGRFVVLVRRQLILAERDESGHEISVRVLFV